MLRENCVWARSTSKRPAQTIDATSRALTVRLRGPLSNSCQFCPCSPDMRFARPTIVTQRYRFVLDTRDDDQIACSAGEHPHRSIDAACRCPDKNITQQDSIGGDREAHRLSVR